MVESRLTAHLWMLYSGGIIAQAPPAVLSALLPKVSSVTLPVLQPFATITQALPYLLPPGKGLLSGFMGAADRQAFEHLLREHLLREEDASVDAVLLQPISLSHTQASARIPRRSKKLHLT